MGNATIQLEEKEKARKRLIEHMNKGYKMGKLLYKHRSELYDR